MWLHLLYAHGIASIFSDNGDRSLIVELLPAVCWVPELCLAIQIAHVNVRFRGIVYSYYSISGELTHWI